MNAHEVPGEHARIFKEWTTAYPSSDPVVRGLILQAATALIEMHRLARIRETVRREKVRTAVLLWERDQEDIVARCLESFNDHAPSAHVDLLRTAAGCRWALAYLERLQRRLIDDGAWYGRDRLGAVQIQGFSACLSELYYSEDAYLTWIDSLATQPNPKQADIDRILDPKHVPKSFQERDVKLWPRDPAESRAAPGDAGPRAAARACPGGDPARPVRGAGAGRSRGDGSGGRHAAGYAVAPGAADPRAVVSASVDCTLEVPQAGRGVARGGGGPGVRRVAADAPPKRSGARHAPLRSRGRRIGPWWVARSKPAQ